MRSFATVLTLFASACAVWASPQRKLVARQDNNNDVTILNFALTLEHLEAEFYRQALEKFGEPDFRRANIPNPTQAVLNFHHILAHEAEHVETLQAVIQSLGGEPVPPCEYNFPLNNVKEFIKLAGVLEKVGVSAYNGAVSLLQNKDLQTAAATIDTIEARHASFLQTENGLDPFPASFDVALDGRQVVTLAAPVIKACPFDLGFAPFGALKVDTSKPLLPGEELTCDFQRESDAQHFCNFLFDDKSEVVPLSDSNTCPIPAEARGDVFLMVINSDQGVSLKDTNSIVAGPLVVDIDTAHGDSCEKFIGKDKQNTVDSAKNGLAQGGDPNAPQDGLDNAVEEQGGLDAPEDGDNVDNVVGALPAEIQAQVDEVNRLKESAGEAPVDGQNVDQLQAEVAADPAAADPAAVDPAAADPAAVDPAAVDPAAADLAVADPAAADPAAADPAAADPAAADPAAADPAAADPAAADPAAADPAAADPAAADPAAADPSAVEAGTVGGPAASVLGAPEDAAAPAPEDAAAPAPTEADPAAAVDPASEEAAAAGTPVLNMSAAPAPEAAAVSADAIQL